MLDCDHCEARLYVEAATRDDEWVPPTLSRSEAGARLCRELAARECEGRPELGSTRLLLVPFWQRPATPGLRLQPAQPDLAVETDGWHVGGADRRPVDFPEMERQGAVVEPTLEPRDDGMSLLFVPFWDVRYSVGATSYRAWVEGNSGGVVSARTPPTLETGLDLAYGALLGILGIFLAGGFRLLWQGGAAVPLGLIVLGAAGGVAVRGGRRFMRRLEQGR